MFLLVIAVVLVLIGLGYVIFADGEKFPKYWGIIPIVLGCLLLFGSMYKKVGPREVGIPETFGHIGADMQSGVHWTAPWTIVHTCSLAQQQAILSQSPTEGDKSGNDGILVNGNDQGQGTADVSVIYHFDPQHSNTLYRRYACDADRVKQVLIRPVVKNAVPASAAQFASVDLKSHRANISAQAVPIMEKIVQGDGIVIDNVLISELVLSDATQKAADAKLAAQQAAQQASFTLQKAQVDKQTVEVNAQAAAAANATKTASLTPQILCQEWIDMLHDAKPTTILVNGPCGSGASTSGPVIVNTGQPAGK